MKRNKLMTMIVLLVTMISFSGCISDENNSDELDGVEYSNQADLGKGNESEFDGAEYEKDEQVDKSMLESISASNIEVFGNGEYSEEIIEEVNLIIMVSNQSFYKPDIEISGYLHGDIVFNSNFEVGNQHEVTYYYLNLEEGKKNLSFETEEVAKQVEIEMKEEEQLWIMVSYWESEDKEPTMEIYESNEPILIL